MTVSSGPMHVCLQPPKARISKMYMTNGLPVKNVENLLVVIVPAQLGDLVQQREQHRVELQVEPKEGYLSNMKKATVTSAADAQILQDLSVVA